MAKDDRTGMLYLVLVELTEILHVHLALLCVDDSGKSVELDLIVVKILDSDYDVAEFADAAWLDQDPLRRILFYHLVERASEITDKRAADASGVHLVDLDARVFQEAFVDTYFAEFVFYKNDLLVTVCLSDKLLDESRLACA